MLRARVPQQLSILFKWLQLLKNWGWKEITDGGTPPHSVATETRASEEVFKKRDSHTFQRAVNYILSIMRQLGFKVAKSGIIVASLQMSKKQTAKPIQQENSIRRAHPHQKWNYSYLGKPIIQENFIKIVKISSLLISLPHQKCNCAYAQGQKGVPPPRECKLAWHPI